MKKIYSASITPFTEEGEIDKKSLERLIEFDIERGIEGFFFLGTMGEWAVLSSSMKDDLLETAGAVIGNRAEIILGAHATGLNGILDNIENYSNYNCSAFAVQLPGGWAKPVDPVSYMHEIADFSSKPVYLYYLPGVNGVSFSKEQFADLFAHPNIAGVKNSSDSLRARKELLTLRQRVDFTLFEGQEWVVDESLALGCDGALVGMAPLGAKLFRMIADAVDDGNTRKAAEYQKIMIEVFDGIYGVNLDTVWVGQKYALKVLNVFSNEKSLVPSQQNALKDEHKERIEKCLEKYHDYLV
jgi:dihydrodipicolinate synthase/N-acetylneuraminate lyase